MADTDVLYFNMMGSHLVVLNNTEVAKELLERRSVVYSDRVRKHIGIQLATPILINTQPRFPMVNELYVPSHFSATAPTNHDKGWNVLGHLL